MPASKQLIYDSTLLFRYFNEMYERLLHIGKVHKLEEPLQRELIHELFVSFYNKEVDFERLTNPTSYIITAYKRKIIDHFRDRADRFIEFPDRDFPLTIIPSYETTKMEMEKRREAELLIAQNFRKLPNRCKKIIYYKFYCNMTMEQIQQVTGWSHQSVYNNLSTGLKLLKKLFQPSAAQLIRGISIAFLVLTIF
ncbi:sigma-70 family RNA polymerase sigma factor [Flavihumibacter sp. CACIAM 22H1]|uniref:RNA polymerase sigma factor n=1 Tax=Flavihumibacter sp. CACIAM 22H1 TaxID=1812911 RepID=UPI0007A84935|nr:sigma-70 family RNA polymerase sigma factor [Flavihumibacter sp. CACIAM 22H1]KYP16609.1 MAG: hypothetical protein A1D16_09350 [Flavihumibacter sp. CACIAM 22H1]